tara:strand:- start:200 stop:1303 length:1104 start_codon:yes stop_codon:yes gene_type:complete
MEYLEREQFTSSIITDTKTANEAREVADNYFKFPVAGHEYYHKGPEKSQEYLNKFYSGYKVDKELSNKNQQVFVGKNNTIVNFISTQSLITAKKTWGDAASKKQSPFIEAGFTALGNLYENIKSSVDMDTGFKLVEHKYEQELKKERSLEERYDDGRELLKKVDKKYPTHQKLLTGYSLGGLVAKKMAVETNQNALVFNAALGKDVFHENKGKTVLEFRTQYDPVSQIFQDDDPTYKNFQIPFKAVKAESNPFNMSDLDNFYVTQQFLKSEATAKNLSDIAGAHFVEHFSKDPKHYQKVLSGEIKLKENTEKIIYRPAPIRSKETIQKMIEVKRQQTMVKQNLYPVLDLYGDVQNFTKKRKKNNLFQ